MKYSFFFLDPSSLVFSNNPMFRTPVETTLATTPGLIHLEVLKCSSQTGFAARYCPRVRGLAHDLRLIERIACARALYYINKYMPLRASQKALSFD